MASCAFMKTYSTCSDYFSPGSDWVMTRLWGSILYAKLIQSWSGSSSSAIMN